MATPKPLAITPGEPSGIGPDLALMLAQQSWPIPLVFIADRDLLAQRADELGLPFKAFEYPCSIDRELSRGEAYVYNVPLKEPVQAGALNPENAQYVLDTLDVAIDGTLNEMFSAIVTGPVHKGVINDAGVPFSGHTEYLQDKCGVERVVMMLANGRMKVALASTHLPLKDVSAAITYDALKQVIDILIADMRQKFAVNAPRVLVAGLNPHAGEGGHMGREEIDVIEPVMSEYLGQDVSLVGPLPADTLFTPKYLDTADAVLAMYHDQGLPVLKYAGFGESVNITLGLPIIRTSVDHGTALDLAGSGNIDAGSFKAAVNMAVEMVSAKA
ncbi:4-hydroxythreonine-4-phosphate dehydrogenase PdxA [Oleiphilus sp. HI0071]|uniref:4-hydroxythreonine-4-phosphate dehydrogenase PdxA n=3 Tax=unclassified Oleiphilus TaxID=2631174 RepID=UPI0007C29137|nr:4-hydroxythreonine-4-phosphate dehydrogenase PdxA [Oleiphilus sp. HI0079]KZY61632.1 4-hydroxythreonine-4-phosphate dehydrogenase PdxA [Oleiphilus sp. HI0065]KZY81251.1 4-hydroxythreonine-4-phosphate dehydrogenase PdxA [Oleiphilus sp. HI0071]KZY92582.1 4-hydroxythreonine-4-phosphate dehydrogenase PdxA [Oleiphilus sp. HI0073]KZZ50537.1 4-hydroxythreonine-4-phosphate dehydrogenase PdxA [Oleiphilus sp. HI0118]KZZ52847.1 4-hydroxythreonine-4-phosphate dehydrogenase PdxA [Oleiphilus sp. HI0122]